jgi:hypothetical protein
MVDAEGDVVMHSTIQHGVYVVIDVYLERMPRQLNTSLATNTTL